MPMKLGVGDVSRIKKTASLRQQSLHDHSRRHGISASAAMAAAMKPGSPRVKLEKSIRRVVESAENDDDNKML